MAKQTFSGPSGVLALTPLTTAGLPASPSDIDYIYTQAKLSITNVGPEISKLESSVGGLIATGFQSSMWEISLEAMDVSNSFIATTHGLTSNKAAANTSLSIDPDFVISNINTTANTDIITAINGATIAANAQPGTYIAKKDTGAISTSPIKYYHFTGSRFREVAVASIFTGTAPTTTETTQVQVQFRISPAIDYREKTHILRGNNDKQYYDLSFFGHDSIGNETPLAHIPRVIPKAPVNYDHTKLEFTNYPVVFLIEDCLENDTAIISNELITGPTSQVNLNA